jgi:conjugal transfer/entry exclusion protein
MYKAARTFAFIVVVLQSTFTASSASAGGGGLGAGATEITQIMNNTELIASVQQQAATVSKLAQSYIVQYNQLREQITAGVKIGGVSLGDVLKMQSDMAAYQTALKKLGTDLSGFQNTIDSRSIEAKLQNLSLKDYISRESQRVQSGNDQAKARVQREIAQAEQIKADITTVRSLGSKIEGTEGVHSATQLLNAQMNVMLQQMTRLVSLTSEAQGSDKAAAIAKEAADREAARAVADQVISNEAAIRNRNRTMIDGMTRTPAR